MSSKQFESTAARLLRLSRQVAELEFKLQATACPDEARRLGVTLRNLREGLRLTQLSKV